MHEQILAMRPRHHQAAMQALQHDMMGRRTSSPATKAGLAMSLFGISAAQQMCILTAASIATLASAVVRQNVVLVCHR